MPSAKVDIDSKTMLAHRLTSSTLIASNTQGLKQTSSLDQRQPQKSRRSGHLTMLPTDSLQATTSALDNHRSHQRAQSNNLAGQQMANKLQMQASALLHSVPEAKSDSSQMQKVLQMKKSLATKQRDNLVAKSRNPAQAITSATKQGQASALIQTLPTMGAASASALGADVNQGTCAMTLLINQQPSRAKAKYQESQKNLLASPSAQAVQL